MSDANSAPSVLKLCSHCGGTRQELDRYAPSPNNKEGGVRVYCQCGMNTGWFDKDDEAIAAWDRRASDPVRAELLEALKAIQNLEMGRGDGSGQDYIDDILNIVNAAITRAEME